MINLLERFEERIGRRIADHERNILGELLDTYVNEKCAHSQRVDETNVSLFNEMMKKEGVSEKLEQENKMLKKEIESKERSIAEHNSFRDSFLQTFALLENFYAQQPIQTLKDPLVILRHEADIAMESFKREKKLGKYAEVKS